MESFTVAAPGKIILHGEHSVVYGKAAIAVSLNLKTEVSVVRNDTSCVEFCLDDLNLSKKWKTSDLINLKTSLPGVSKEPIQLSDADTHIIKQFIGLHSDESNPSSILDQTSLALVFLFKGILQKQLKVNCGLRIGAKSQLPTSAGLGSSASIAVCLSAAFLKLSESIHSVDLSQGDLDLINRWAFMVEKIFHGNPSGLDNTVAVHGGAVFCKNGSFMPMQLTATLRILAVNTMVSRNTKAIVSSVRSRKDKYPDIINPVLDAMDELVRQVERTLQHLGGDSNVDSDVSYGMLEELIDMNQALLEALGVSHPQLQKVISIAGNRGLHAKLTGAGGGGFAFALIRPGFSAEILELIKSDLTGQSFQCWEVFIGGRGVHFF